MRGLPWAAGPLCGSAVPPWGLSLRRIFSLSTWLGQWHCSGMSRWPDTPPVGNNGRSLNALSFGFKPKLKTVCTLVFGTTPRPSLASTNEAAASER